MEAFRAALEERTRERAPFDWAATHNNLGNVLNILGKREESTARHEQAIAAFKTALSEYTRERAPLQWAMVNYNLGGTFFLLA